MAMCWDIGAKVGKRGLRHARGLPRAAQPTCDIVGFGTRWASHVLLSPLVVDGVWMNNLSKKQKWAERMERGQALVEAHFVVFLVSVILSK